MNNTIYLLALHQIWISQQKLNILFKDNENYKEVFENIDESFLEEINVQKRYVKSILSKKQKINFVLIENKLKERKVRIVTINDNEYPKLLKQISNPPYLLYVRWKLDNSLKISVVWARAITSYWKKVIENIVPWLSKYFTIVSWWAYWCDTESHKQALNSWNKTIAVIWTWIDQDYPTGNKTMYDKIVETWWAVISIFSIWEPWNPYNFPIRNEVVAWLSVWTLVIEAKEKSGSLITAGLTLDLGRDLFAVPWDIFRANSKWCNEIIKKWEAKPVLSSSDVLEEYNIWTGKKQEENKNIKFADKIEEEIYNLLLLESLNSDEIANKLDLNISGLAMKLSFMEITGIVKKGLGGKYEVN